VDSRPCTFSLALLCFRFHFSFTLSAAAQTQPRQLDDKLRAGLNVYIHIYIFFFSFFSFSSLFFKCFFTLHRAPIIIASLLLRRLSVISTRSSTSRILTIYFYRSANSIQNPDTRVRYIEIEEQVKTMRHQTSEKHLGEIIFMFPR